MFRVQGLGFRVYCLRLAQDRRLGFDPGLLGRILPPGAKRFASNAKRLCIQRLTGTAVRVSCWACAHRQRACAKGFFVYAATAATWARSLRPPAPPWVQYVFCQNERTLRGEQSSGLTYTQQYDRKTVQNEPTSAQKQQKSANPKAIRSDAGYYMQNGHCEHFLEKRAPQRKQLASGTTCSTYLRYNRGSARTGDDFSSYTLRAQRSV